MCLSLGFYTNMYHQAKTWGQVGGNISTTKKKKKNEKGVKERKQQQQTVGE